MFLADKIFYNGKIYTMEQENETVEAIAVYQGKIIAAGTEQEIKEIPAKESVDLNGKTVLPGFADTHMHLYQDCMDRRKIDLESVASISEILSTLKEKAASVTGNHWLFGENIHADRLKEYRFPTREELDSISKDIPIMVGSFCRHTHVLNSKALEICEIPEHRDSIPKDMLEYTPDGKLNGALKEWVYDTYVFPHIPVPTEKETLGYYKEYLDYVASQGITQLHAYQQDNPYGIMVYQELRKQEKLPCRITFNFLPDDKSNRNIATGFGDDYLKVGATKFLADGSIGAASALMYEPYDDIPGEYGIMTHSQEELNEMVKKAYDSGNDVAVHAIGDKANDMVLTAFENCYKPEYGWSRRFYIIHATVISDSFIERAKKLPLIINTQPIFLRNFINLTKQRIGIEREERLMPLKTLMENNIIVTSGSDAPVRELNPFHGIECSVTRQDWNYEEIISPKEKISVYQAICMYTKYAAYCVHEENLKGTITPGKTADFIVLDRNPFTCPVEELHMIQVERTFTGGEEVYTRM